MRRVLAWMFAPYTESHRRRQLAIGAAGALLAAAGLLPLALLLPELPFAGAPTTLIGNAQPGDAVKVYGQVDCACLIAIEWSQEQVGLGLSATNVSFVAFTVKDPSGTFFVDTDSVATVKPGAHNGNYWKDDFLAVFGHVYDQGNGVLAIRAEFIAPTVDDTPAVHWGWLVLAAAVGGVLLSAAVADRVLFGAAAP